METINTNEMVRQMQISSVKQEAYRLLDYLPETATWDDLMYEIYVRQAIEAGLSDSQAGRTFEVNEVRVGWSERSELQH